MTFQIATQNTDLDRVDNIRAAVEAAQTYRVHYADVELPALIEAAQGGNEPAMLELIARSEGYLRSIVSEFRASNGAAEPDLQQAAMLGFLEALADFVPDGRAEFQTFAYSRVRRALTDANRTASPVPIASTSHQRFFAAMRAADNDPAVARTWSQLQRGSIAELEIVAESGGTDATLAREIIDHRVDVYEQHVKRGYVTTGRGKGDRAPVPEWEVYRNQAGRGLSGHEFDTVLASVTYSSLDGARDAAGDDQPEPVANPVTADPEAANPYTAVDDRIALHQLLDTLRGTEWEVVHRHLQGDTDREIATFLGLSRPRVVNIRAGAIKRLQRLAQV